MQFKLVSMRSEKPINYAHQLVFQVSPNVAFETVPIVVWLTIALSRPLKEDRRAISLLHDSVLQVLDDVMSLALRPKGSVASSCRD